jgi:hypothetical protein
MAGKAALALPECGGSGFLLPSTTLGSGRHAAELDRLRPGLTKSPVTLMPSNIEGGEA